MRETQDILERGCPSVFEQGVILPAQADEAIFEGETARQMRGRRVEPTDGEVDLLGFDQPDRIVAVGGAQVQHDPGRNPAQMF